jgi:hypothetical protein
LGGEVSSYLATSSDYGARIKLLGFNKLPRGLEGEPSEIFEQYVYEGLQFSLPGRVLRYGKERSFEPLPDGISFERNQPFILYDAKAYGKGYPMTIGSIRQFADYVDDFNERYSALIGRVYRFVVISGKFTGNMQEKAAELYKKCKVGLSYLTANDLAKMTELIKDVPKFRSNINWFTIFSRENITAKLVEAEIKRVKKDGIVEA